MTSPSSKTATEESTPALQALWRERFRDLPWACGQPVPGILDDDEWRDWDNRETTPDQARIEDYVDRYSLSGKRIFHVGIGNSHLARRFVRRGASVVGTTISPAEFDRAAKLALPRYQPRLENKHDAAAGDEQGRIDFLVDNNPTTFCCCMEHLGSMMATYRDLLGTDGQIVTDRVGLGWTTSVPGANPRWGFDFSDFEAVGKVFGLQASQRSEFIYVLSRHGPRDPGLLSLVRYHATRTLLRIGRKLRSITRQS